MYDQFAARVAFDRFGKHGSPSAIRFFVPTLNHGGALDIQDPLRVLVINLFQYFGGVAFGFPILE
jgi:hypothetical protein